MAEPKYNEDSIRTLDWKEHIRLRPGMYIGKLGDGSSQDDGIYILLKETIDNCIDEYVMGHGKNIEISIKDRIVKVRDYGRGIPLGKTDPAHRSRFTNLGKESDAALGNPRIAPDADRPSVDNGGEAAALDADPDAVGSAAFQGNRQWQADLVQFLAIDHREAGDACIGSSRCRCSAANG